MDCIVEVYQMKISHAFANISQDCILVNVIINMLLLFKVLLP